MLQQIKSIKEIGKTIVYDIINVQNNNNYIANNFIVHNSSEDWAKKENKELKKKLAQVRTKHLLFVLCFPLKIQKVDKTYLDSNVNYWCLDGNTKIYIKDTKGINRKLPMRELAHLNGKKTGGWKVLSYNKEQDIFEYKNHGRCVKTQKDVEVYEVMLENGQTIEATAEHLFLTKTGYKQLKDLTENDEIIVVPKKCLQCNKDFFVKRHQQKFCSPKCSNQFRAKTEKTKKKLQEYNEKNKEIIKEKKRKYYLDNHQKFLEVSKTYRVKNRELLQKKAREYRANNRVKQRLYINNLFKKYMQEKPEFKIKTLMRARLNFLVKKNKLHKRITVIKLLGVPIETVKEHIEKQFKPGMSWENHGGDVNGWQIDHIRPCCSFDLTKFEDQKKCFHYTNLQPLWAKENFSKGGRYVINKD